MLPRVGRVGRGRLMGAGAGAPSVWPRIVSIGVLMAKGQRVGYVRVSTVDQNTERVVIGSSLGVEAARVELEVS